MKAILDLHIHTQRSYDGRMTLEAIATRAKARGLDAVAICDHDLVHTGPTEVDGILLIPGAEFSTEHGHLLALFVDTPMEYTTFPETAKKIRALGGLTVLAHPFQKKRDPESLLPLLPHLDGMEVWNSRADRKNPTANAMAAAFAKTHGLLPFAGSDAHLPQEIGGGTLTVEVDELTLPALKAALLAGEGTVRGRRGRSLWVAKSQYTRLKKNRAPLTRYGKWAAFALKCAWEDIIT